MSDRTGSLVAGRLTARRGVWKLFSAICFSAVLLILLLVTIEPGDVFAQLASVRYDYAPVAIACFVLSLTVRGERLRLLSGQAGFWQWARVAAWHQMLFTVLPSGLGDAGFPVLARRQLGMRSLAATRMIAIYRLQDLSALALLLSASLATGRLPIRTSSLWLVTGAVSAATLLVADKIVDLAIVAASRNRYWLVKFLPSRLTRGLTSHQIEVDRGAMAVTLRLRAGLLALVSWVLAMAAFAALFRMAGLALSPAELMFVVGGLNLCGALATFTFAGLGVGESALAGLLMLLQFPTEQAVPVALVVRPAALVNTLLSSAIVDAIHRVERAFRPATKRTT